MLGITVPDAIALGTLILALLAGFRGTRAGAEAKKNIPPDPPTAMIGGAIVDTMTLRDLTTSVQNVADAINATIAEEKQSREAHLSVTLDRLLKELSARDDERERNSTRRR
jgi:hypothetical protein